MKYPVLHCHKTWLSILVLLITAINSRAQLQIKDIGPTGDNAEVTQAAWYQSVSGKSLTIAMSSNGLRVYLGGHSGVWRSNDGGANWTHLVRPQPAVGSVNVPGALLCPNVYDIFVSPLDEDLVLVATGRDARSPSQAGIYKSTNGGNSWARVHQFASGTSVGITSRIVSVPGSPNRIFAAGQFSIGISNDGGDTWTEVNPAGTANLNVFSIAAATQRKIYAAGSRVWYSLNDGATWTEEPAARELNLTVGAPADGLGESSKTLTVHPNNSNIIYLTNNRRFWKGDFTNIATTGRATWRELPGLPPNIDGATASGTDYIVAHVTSGGQLLLIASDRLSVNVSVGDPVSTASWKRIDSPDVHIDPHGMDLTSAFRFYGAGSGVTGRMVFVSDGGAYYSTDGAKTWKRGKGLYTLGLVNGTVMSDPRGDPAICIGTGDNSGFFTKNGGQNWKTQDYLGGDNDACFSDPLQPNRLIVFAPRSDRTIRLYKVNEGQTPDGARGTTQRTIITGAPFLEENDVVVTTWNATSSHFNAGYRSLVYTLAGQRPRPDGDFITIWRNRNRAALLRTTKMSTINNANDWVTTATTESSGAKVFQQGPDLPSTDITVVQASGGHENPVFYIGNQTAGVTKSLWKWRQGDAGWRQIVPGPVTNGSIPQVANRFFVDPYRPNTVYVLDRDAIRRSDNGGTSWTVDTRLQNAITENGAFPFVIPDDGNPGEALLRDMIFDPYNPGYRFAIGPAGVFYTTDGTNWRHFILTKAMPMRPNNASYDPCERALYVATNNRGILQLSPLPPEYEGPVGGLYAAEGKITMLRVHDVGTKYGPANDQIDVEVVIKLDSRGDDAFGFQLRKDDDEVARTGMLDLLRQAFKQNRTIRIDYNRKGCRTGEIIRAWTP